MQDIRHSKSIFSSIKFYMQMTFALEHLLAPRGKKNEATIAWLCVLDAPHETAHSKYF